ncbi:MULTISPECIES: DUF3817 domain-containing protein [Bhargavaea]|uniref:DUF3817 domain-containing protein n=1 Tax=Bhargavaea changchunensis TaxID=2134037 RepID=A0ABW2NNH1_9BACL|nr:DUF3817 domain-containing protein [Bhargavaea sp. CC-171006]
MSITALKFVRAVGIADGVSLLVLLFIAMPLKYMAGMPLAVSIVGAIHGGIFVTYLLALLLAQIVVRWNIIWSVLGIAAAFVPFANFVLDRKFKKMQKEREEETGIQVVS